MVPITQDLPIAEQPNLRVYSPGGSYGDTDLILCADVADMATPTSMLQAQFIKYGTMVYQFNTPEDLGKAIIEIEPNSTHDAAALYREQVARDAARTAGTLVPSDPVPATDSPAIDATTSTTENTVPDPVSVTSSTEPAAPLEAAPLPPPDPVTTAQMLEPLPTDNYLIDGATTTPSLNVSSTTPALDLSTTTPE